MAYVAPTITASGGTFAQLKTGGLPVILELLITANTGAGCSLTQGQTDAIRALSRPNVVTVSKRAAEVVDHFLRGDPVTYAAAAQQILDYATVSAVLATAMNEIGVLAFANQGTLGYTTTASGMPLPVRTF